MSICTKCKTTLPDSATFCPTCGKKQSADRRKDRKRANGTGNISRLSGNRSKPWIARKNGVSIGTYTTRGEAQKALERLTDVTVNDKFNMTFTEVYERWHAEHRREISDSMDKNYKLAYKQCSQLHHMQMRKILRSDYQACIIALEMQGKSKSTCNKLRVLPGQLGRWAMEEGITLTNPAEDLSTVAKQKSERRAFTEAEIDGMNPYNCRHTFITRAIRSGMDLPVLEAIVGHVDRETTKIYTHLHADDLVSAVQVISGTPLTVCNKSATRSGGSKKPVQKSS